MEKKEITILDLVKIALNWIWVLLLGGAICAAVAFFYSTKMVTPMYSASSKYVVQAKGQEATSDDILASQRVVAYAQLVVGTYVDILNTRDFAVDVANYMNGEYPEKEYSAEGKQKIINASIRQAIFEDGGLVEGGKFDAIIDALVDAKIIDDESYKTLPVREAAKNLIEGASVLTDERFDLEVIDGIASGKIIPDVVYSEDQLFAGISNKDRTVIDEIRDLLGNKEYDYRRIKGMISFSSAEESTTFTITVKSDDADEAYFVARVCEIIIPSYIESHYPGSGLVSTIDSAVYNPGPINNNTALLTLVGFVAGFVLAFVVVYIIELADNRIKNQEELAEKTGLSVMGIIPDVQYEKNNVSPYANAHGKKFK
ncbi:MAG: hypothetical protein IJW06_00990 [Clostridia bacterium]|nr:hypothetical protein [Clostridia bacterium]